MMEKEKVLALQPSSQGVGFAVLAGAESILDWGVKRTRSGNKNANALKVVQGMIQHYRPAVIVLENHSSVGSRRQPRVQRLMDGISRLAAKYRIATCRFSRAQVRKAFAFAGARTKQQIASVVAERFPELAPQLPPPRKIWKSEDHRQSTFDAVSFALTFYEAKRTQQRAA